MSEIKVDHEDLSALPEQRRQKILLTLQMEGQVLAADLSQRFNVSEDTVRRDLRELARAGMVKRVYGGAVPLALDTGKPYVQRANSQEHIKQELAQAALALIRPRQILFLDASTTNRQIARALPNDVPLTVVTNCPPIAVDLSDHPLVTIIMPGGKLNKAMQALTGPECVEKLSQVNADLCFLGVCAIHPHYGICSENDEEVFVKRAMLEHAAEVAIIATEDKVGAVEGFKIAPIDKITHMITPDTVPKDLLTPYVEKAIRVIPVGETSAKTMRRTS
ncbi:DeoR/GlpR family DNA-binding transcription regulator [Pseudovibrio exalbescens]|nr:DeoR/GlpR family DNA-binding transcription regulator [Pseudovibrio exalbescens]